MTRKNIARKQNNFRIIIPWLEDFCEILRRYIKGDEFSRILKYSCRNKTNKLEMPGWSGYESFSKNKLNHVRLKKVYQDLVSWPQSLDI